MSLIELQQYQLLNVDDIILNIDDSVHSTMDYYSVHQRSHSSNTWLDRCIFYCPMYAINKPNGSQRNKYLSIFIIFTIILANIALEIPFIYSIEIENIYHAMNVLSLLCHAIKLSSRFGGLYYFYSKFNYQYRYYTPSKFDELSNKKHNNNKLLLVILIIFVFIEIVWIYGVCSDSNYYHFHQMISFNWVKIVKWMYCMVHAIVFDGPVILTLTVHYLLCVKYQQYLMQMIDDLKKRNIDLETIFDRYKLLYQLFNTEYVCILKLTIQCYLFHIILVFWLNIYNMSNYERNTILWRMSTNIWCILVVIIYTIPSSRVCKQYFKFEDELWSYSEYGHRNKSQEQISSKHQEINYLLHFIKKFPVMIRIGNLCTVTIYNTLLGALIFVVALAQVVPFQ